MQDVPLTLESLQQFRNGRDTLRQLAQASQYAAGGLCRWVQTPAAADRSASAREALVI